jgi:tetratricopeptide (TPR) repeat protein
MKILKYILLPLLSGLMCTGSAFAEGRQSLVPAGERKALTERKQQERIYFFHEGKKRVTFGDMKGAAYCFRRAIKADPYCDACYFELANIAVDMKQPADALELLQAAYALDSANVWYTLRLGQLLALNNELTKAEVYYEKVLTLNPNLQKAYAELMFIYDKEKKYDEGVKMIARYQQNFGIDESSIISKQGFLYKGGKINEAIAEAKTLVEMYPSEQQYRLMLAELYGVQRSDSLAFDALEKAQALDSASLEYMVALSDYYRRLSDFESYFATMLTLFASKLTPAATKLQVLDFLQQFPAIEQQYTAAIDSLYSLTRTKYSYQTELLFSKYLIQTQRLKNAIASLKLLTARGAYDAYLLDVIKSKRESKFFSAYAHESVAYYEAWNLFFDILISRQAWSHLFAEADSYASVFPDKYRADFLKGLARFQEQKHDEAISFWLKAEEASTQADTAFRAQLYSSIGDVYFLQKKYSLVDKYFEKSLKLNPKNVLTLNNYAYYLSLRKTKLKKALAMSKITVDAEPDNATYLDTYAWILYEMKRYEESKKVFQRALVLGGNEEGVMLEHYGDVLYALKEFSNAQIYWKRALEQGNDTPELREKLKRKE